MKKKINTILIVAVLALWGVVGYRTYKNYFLPLQNERSELSERGNTAAFRITEKDTFTMETLERDPFQGRARLVVDRKVATSSGREKDRSEFTARSVAEDIKFPSVQYFGYIKAHESSSETALIKIGSALKRLKKDQTFGGMKIHRIFKDSVIVKYGGMLKTCRRA
jgi:hypothetical protein